MQLIPMGTALISLESLPVLPRELDESAEEDQKRASQKWYPVALKTRRQLVKFTCLFFFQVKIFMLTVVFKSILQILFSPRLFASLFLIQCSSWYLFVGTLPFRLMNAHAFA